MISCLLVEDDPDDQEIFMMCLDRLNIDIDCSVSNDGKEAIDKVKDGHYQPDFIFLDLNMPRMDGIECLEKLRNMPSLDKSSIIIYSTTGEKNIILKSRELGANDFIVKPTAIAELRNRLTQVFSKT